MVETLGNFLNGVIQAEIRLKPKNKKIKVLIVLKIKAIYTPKILSMDWLVLL